MYTDQKTPPQKLRKDYFVELYNYLVGLSKEKVFEGDLPPPLDTRPRDVTYKIFYGVDATIALSQVDTMLGLCRHNIAYDYIQNLQEQSENLSSGMIVIFQYLNGTEVGFSVLQPLKDKKIIYVHLFCTSTPKEGLGEKLLAYIKDNICKSCRLILNSVSSAVGFYTKMGFRKQDPNDPNDDLYVYDHNLKGGTVVRIECQKGKLCAMHAINNALQKVVVRESDGKAYLKMKFDEFNKSRIRKHMPILNWSDYYKDNTARGFSIDVFGEKLGRLGYFMHIIRSPSIKKLSRGSWIIIGKYPKFGHALAIKDGYLIESFTKYKPYKINLGWPKSFVPSVYISVDKRRPKADSEVIEIL
jgi:hypothetical protein